MVSRTSDGPVIGTPRLPVARATVANRGPIARVPTLIGTTADEFTLSVAISYLRNERLAPYRTLLENTFGAEAPVIAARYPLQRYGGSTALAYAATVTDGVFACPVDVMAADLAGRAPVYAYEFNDRSAPVAEPIRRVPFPIGAAHALE